MKEYFKYGIYLVITLTVAYICTTLRSCGEGGDTSAIVVTPADKSFSPVIKRSYKPASTPFEHPSKPSVRLPKGLPESDVKNVLIVVKSISLNDSTIHRFIDSTAIIIAKNGSIYIDTAQVKTVEMIAYEEPLLRFGSFISLGVMLQQGLHLTLAAAFSPLQICGVVQFPFLALDTEGIGGGISARAREISFGILFHQPFFGERQLKLSFTYNL
jgi:hypothetical protein